MPGSLDRQMYEDEKLVGHACGCYWLSMEALPARDDYLGWVCLVQDLIKRFCPHCVVAINYVKKDGLPPFVITVTSPDGWHVLMAPIISSTDASEDCIGYQDNRNRKKRVHPMTATSVTSVMRSLAELLDQFDLQTDESSARGSLVRPTCEAWEAWDALKELVDR
jgi:hypothetical protein